MSFEEIVDQALDMMCRRGRMSYRMLKRQFDLDDQALEDLKEELIYSQRLVVDEDDKVLVWIGDPAAPEREASNRTDIEVRFHAILPVLTGLLQREGRMTYRVLTQIFAINENLLADIRKELTFRELARDERGEGLVWIGDVQSVVQTAVATTPLATNPETTEVMPSVEAERRQLTVMFCDLADSTELSQQLDPEDLREVVRAYQATAAEVIEQYEGHVAQYLGDGLLIYFGWPQAHEDDAQRAVHAGLGIVEAITTSLNPRLVQEKGVQLIVRIGIHTGPVVVGEMGGGERHENLATGETVNIAARLEGLAASNTVVVSSVTERLVCNAFALDALGPHVLKGVADPMPTFRVIGPLEDDENEMPTVGIPFLVGRDEEVGLLMRRWEQAKEGLGQVVLVSGEAGIGKSSLVAAVRHHVVQEGYTRMTVRCSPYHTNSALYPVIEHVQRVLQFEPGDTPAARLDKLERVLGGYSRPLEEMVPLFADLLSLPLPEGRYNALNLAPQQQRQQTQDALVGWLLEEAERHPTLVMWEDLHWADPSTLEYLGLVLEQTPTVPMLHVLTFRPEFEPPWSIRSHMTPITLNRLERPQVEALITHMGQGKTLPAEVVEYVVTKTDGVPLFVEELTKTLLTSEFLHENVDHYALTGPLAGIAIPDTLQDSLMARLDRLGSAKEVAQLGAVLGREFIYEMLQTIAAQADETLQAGLAQLIEAELLYQRGRPPRAKYLFKHALIQDAAYASLLKSTRQQVHQRIATMLASQFPETAETQPELLAYHFTEAQVNEQAVHYWHEAGRRTVARSAYAEAISHFEKGLEVLALLPETAERAHQELTLQMGLGRSLMLARGYATPELEPVYLRAQRLCEQVGDRRRLIGASTALWSFYLYAGQLPKAREMAEQDLRMASPHTDSRHLVSIHNAMALTLNAAGELTQARTHFETAIALYDRHDHRLRVTGVQDYGVTCRSFVAGVLWRLGYPDQARQRSQEALALAYEVEHPISLAVGMMMGSTMLYRDLRQMQAVLEQADAVLTLANEHKFVFYLARGMVYRGWALGMQGQSEAGIEQMRQGMGVAEAAWAEAERVRYPVMLAEVFGQAGQTEKGLDILDEALVQIDHHAYRLDASERYRLKGKLLLQQSADNQADAETCFHQALSIARHQQAKSWELRAASSLARLWQSQGKRQEAYDLLEPVYSWFTEGFDTTDLKEAKTLMGELAE